MTLKEIRLQLGMSQSKFARFLDMPVINISHWEQGVRKPPEYVEKLIKRVVRLECGIDVGE